MKKYGYEFNSKGTGAKRMDIRKATREVRLERWAEILRDIQASGMSITAWCETNGVDRNGTFIITV